MAIRLDRRSIICTPGTATERFTVAQQSGADVGLVDLEDSVVPSRKAEARGYAETYLHPASAPNCALALRINSPCGVDGLRDLLAVAAYARRPAMVLIPKVESSRDVDIVAAALDSDDYSPELYAVIETPRGVEQLPWIVRSPRLGGVVFGAADYAFEVGTALCWEALLFVRSAIVNAAATAGLTAIDSPYFALGNLAGLRWEAMRSKALGYCGKIAVHPRQVPIINTSFFPSDNEIARARSIVAAGEGSGLAVGTAEGQMVGKPFFAAAHALLAQVDNHRTDGTPPESRMSGNGAER